MDCRRSETPAGRAWITGDLYWNAILCNTFALTQLTGSSQNTVIPPEASASLDIRLLPDQDSSAFLAERKRVINDSLVEVVPPATMRARMSNPTDTDLFRALGIITYGFDPCRVESADMQTGMHGNDERLAIENVGFGVRYLYDVLRYVQ